MKLILENEKSNSINQQHQLQIMEKISEALEAKESDSSKAFSGDKKRDDGQYISRFKEFIGKQFEVEDTMSLIEQVATVIKWNRRTRKAYDKGFPVFGLPLYSKRSTNIRWSCSRWVFNREMKTNAFQALEAKKLTWFEKKWKALPEKDRTYISSVEALLVSSVPLEIPKFSRTTCFHHHEREWKRVVQFRCNDGLCVQSVRN